MSINGAELKVILGALGLPPSWFAGRMNVTMRTVVRWFDGADVSDEVHVELRNLEALTLEEMRNAMSTADTTPAGTTVLKTYRTDEEFEGPYFVDDVFNGNMPSSWHRQLTFRVLEHLRAQGRTVMVRYS
jgi:hypothetical protein